MHARATSQRRRIGAEAADRGLPHLSAGVLKMRSRSTSLISHADASSSASSWPGPSPSSRRSAARIGGGVGSSSRRSRSGDVERYSPSAIAHRRAASSLSSGSSPTRIQLRCGSTGPPTHTCSSRSVDTGGSRFTVTRPGRHQRPVDDQAERALVAVLAQQDDGPAEVRIDQLRHRQQQRRARGMRP